MIDTLDVLFVRPESFRASPQIGTACRVTFRELAAYLGRPTIGESKEIAGAWSPALYAGSVRRKSTLLHACALVVDVDEGGDVDHVSGLVARYRAIVHSTFSSTPEVPRCRVVIALAEVVDAPTYEATHKVIRAHLRAAGVIADEGAKDASRVSYAPVVRPGASFRCVALDGEPLDAVAVLAAQPPEPPRSAPRLVALEHSDGYRRGALRRAAAAVSNASDGERHYTLSKEAFCLARLDLSEQEIAGALLPAFVSRAGEPRRREGERTIRDACRARGAA